MILSAAGASGAAAAARRRMLQEEEEMTPYRGDELAQDWQFKILRSVTGAFGKPQQLQRILEEEARAGWMFVEKFDNSRIRLKRPASAQAGDAELGIDPYRTYVGMSEARFAAVLVVSIIGGLLLFMLALAIAMMNIK